MKPIGVPLSADSDSIDGSSLILQAGEATVAFEHADPVVRDHVFLPKPPQAAAAFRQRRPIERQTDNIVDAAAANRPPFPSPGQLADTASQRRSSILARLRGTSAGAPLVAGVMQPLEFPFAPALGQIRKERAEALLPAPAVLLPQAQALVPLGRAIASLPDDSGHEKIAETERALTEFRIKDIATTSLRREVEFLRGELSQTKATQRNSDVEVIEMRRVLRDAEEKLAKLKGTISYQVGSALVEAAQSLHGAVRLPGNLLKVFRASRKLKQKRSKARAVAGLAVSGPAESLRAVNEALALAARDGGEAAVTWARGQNLPPAALARTLIEVAKSLRHSDPLGSAAVAREAIALNPGEDRVKWLALALFEGGHTSEAADLLDQALKAGVKLNPTEARKVDLVRSTARLAASLPDFPEKTEADIKLRQTTRANAAGILQRVVFFGRECLPYHLHPPSVRLHERAVAARTQGWQTIVMTPPGYPERHGKRAAGEFQRSDYANVSYMRLSAGKHGKEIADLHLGEAAEQMAAALRQNGAALLHAEAFGPTALSAALAAERAGCPFVLDVHDLIDPRLPFAPGRERTEAFHMQLSATIMAGQRADRCIVRSMLMREALRRGGVPSEKIEIVADATAAVGVPAPTRDAALANELGLVDTRVFGYVGGLHAIQEPERLVNILDALKDSHRDLRLLLVGPGRRADAVRERATELRLSGRVVIVDNPPVTQTARFQSLIDVAVFAKSASLAASLAAPQEILEAMAHGRAIVASRTYDAVELIQDRSNGLLGESHDIVGLAALVARLLDNDAWRRAIGRSAQSSLAREASHTAVGQKLDRIFRAVL